MSFSADQLLILVSQSRIVPVFYHPDPDHTRQIVQACYDGGLRVFEFTNRGSSALTTFSELVPYVRLHCPQLALGIGTILTPAEADAFLEAGADFVVQPVITPAVGDRCRERDIPWIPAGMTVTEIYQATVLGANLVKVFPGSSVGPAFIKAIKGPLPQLKLMVTGGIDPTIESIQPWFKAGVTAVGVGSQLFAGQELTPDLLRKRITDLLGQLTLCLP